MNQDLQNFIDFVNEQRSIFKRELEFTPTYDHDRYRNYLEGKIDALDDILDHTIVRKSAASE